jgi:acyl-CoA thioesterase FadM
VAVEHTERFRVAWVDTDAGGRIHFTAAFRWAEAAETGLRRRLGVMEGWGDYPRRYVTADFKRVLVFEDEIEVTIRAADVGTSSITWAWRIERDGELCVDGTMVVVHVDEHDRPRPLPVDFRAALSS